MRILDKELLIPKILGMTEFQIKIERGSWDLSKILEYTNNLKKMKCTFELDCDKEVYAVHKEDGTARWYNHYSMSIGNQKEIRKKYKRINDIIRYIENTFLEFQDALTLNFKLL